MDQPSKAKDFIATRELVGQLRRDFDAYMRAVEQEPDQTVRTDYLEKLEELNADLKDLEKAVKSFWSRFLPWIRPGPKNQINFLDLEQRLKDSETAYIEASRLRKAVRDLQSEYRRIRNPSSLSDLANDMSLLESYSNYQRLGNPQSSSTAPYHPPAGVERASPYSQSSSARDRPQHSEESGHELHGFHSPQESSHSDFQALSPPPHYRKQALAAAQERSRSPSLNMNFQYPPRITSEMLKNLRNEAEALETSSMSSYNSRSQVHYNQSNLSEEAFPAYQDQDSSSYAQSISSRSASLRSSQYHNSNTSLPTHLEESALEDDDMYMP